jgi:hypothetical protein
MSENEDRQLHIMIAQLNAKLEFYLFTCLGLFGGAIAFVVSGYELLTSPKPVLSDTLLVSGLILVGLAGWYLYKLYGCLKAFESLQ